MSDYEGKSYSEFEFDISKENLVVQLPVNGYNEKYRFLSVNFFVSSSSIVFLFQIEKVNEEGSVGGGVNNSVGDASSLLRRNVPILKDVLFSYLRMAQQSIFESGLILPVVGVVSINDEDKRDGNKDLIKTVAAWSRDQEWHRGNFSLFCVYNKEEKGLVESLLSLHFGSLKFMDVNSKRDLKYYIDELRDCSDQCGGGVRSLAESCVRYLEDGSEGDGVADIFDSWTRHNVDDLVRKMNM